MRFRLLRPVAAALAAALLGVPAAQAAVVFKGFSADQKSALESDLGRSLFPFSALLDVVVKPGDLPDGALGLATSNGLVVLDAEALASDGVRTFALLHELSHQVDYQLLRDSERGRFYEAAGFGRAREVRGYADVDWYDGGLAHDQIPAEQFASAFPLAVWPVERGNTYVAADGACIGWEAGEGCRAQLDVVRAIVNAILAQNGRAPLEGFTTESFVETYVPPMSAAPAERELRAPDAGITPIATSLAAVEPLTGATKKKESVLRVRLSAPLGAVPDAAATLDVQVKGVWYQLRELRTDGAGEIAYRFRPKGWRPTAFRVTFAGAANLSGASLVVPIEYKK